MDHHQIAKSLIAVALLIGLIGVVFYLIGDKLTWIGRLPGDIRVKRENFSFYFPLTTMILLSIIVNVLVRIYRYFS